MQNEKLKCNIILFVQGVSTQASPYTRTPKTTKERFGEPLQKEPLISLPCVRGGGTHRVTEGLLNRTVEDARPYNG